MTVASQPRVSRRHFVKGATAAGFGAVGAGLLQSTSAQAADSIDQLIAKPPAGFVPMNVPGKIAKVAAKGDFASIMQPNQLWPKPEIAKRLLEKAMMEFTGAANLVEAHEEVHPQGRRGRRSRSTASPARRATRMAINFELILPVVEGRARARCAGREDHGLRAVPGISWRGRASTCEAGSCRPASRPARTTTTDHPMPDIKIYQGIKTKYCKFFTRCDRRHRHDA